MKQGIKPIDILLEVGRKGKHSINGKINIAKFNKLIYRKSGTITKAKDKQKRKDDKYLIRGGNDKFKSK